KAHIEGLQIVRAKSNWPCCLQVAKLSANNTPAAPAKIIQMISSHRLARRTATPKSVSEVGSDFRGAVSCASGQSVNTPPGAFCVRRSTETVAGLMEVIMLFSLWEPLFSQVVVINRPYAKTARILQTCWLIRVSIARWEGWSAGLETDLSKPVNFFCPG